MDTLEGCAIISDTNGRNEGKGFTLRRRFALLHFRFSAKSQSFKRIPDRSFRTYDDITHFQYIKKNSRYQAPAVVGIEVKDYNDFHLLVKRMKAKGYYGEYLNEKPQLFQYLV